MIIEFVLHRLKVPDGANRPPTEPEQHSDVTATTAAAAASAAAYSTRAESKVHADSKEEELSVGGAPFLQKMSTDGDESVLCKRSIIVEQPYK
jgi:hypothetical protein